MRLESCHCRRWSRSKVFRGRIADKDAPVIASAVLGGADYLVTGDRKDFGRLKTTLQPPPRIVAPAEFVDEGPSRNSESLGAGNSHSLPRSQKTISRCVGRLVPGSARRGSAPERVDARRALAPHLRGCGGSLGPSPRPGRSTHVGDRQPHRRHGHPPWVADGDQKREGFRLSRARGAQPVAQAK